MPDSENVMSCLEGLTQDDWRMFHSDSEVQEIARNALALLKEQEAINPEVEVLNEIDRLYRCPRCHKCILVKLI